MIIITIYTVGKNEKGGKWNVYTNEDDNRY